MSVINFVAAQWDSILLVLAFLAIVVFAIVKGNKKIVMQMLYAAVTEAEKKFGGGTGSLKLAAVIEEVYPKIPVAIRAFVTQKMLVKWVEDALTFAKESWAKNENIADYIG